MITQPTNSELLQAITENKSELLQVISNTKSEVLETIADTKSELLQKMQQMESCLQGQITDLQGQTTDLQEQGEDLTSSVASFAENTEHRLSALESDMKVIKSTMVTKDYLDRKITDLRADMLTITRKEDTKVNTLTRILGRRKMITGAEEKQVLGMEPFARKV